MTTTNAIAAAAIMAVAVLLPTPCAAQLNGDNIRGDAGLKSGSQPPPGAYVLVPLWFYTADKVKDRNGDEILGGTLDSALFGGGLSVVTPKKFLGAREVGARTTTEGAAWNLLAAFPLKPIRIP